MRETSERPANPKRHLAWTTFILGLAGLVLFSLTLHAATADTVTQFEATYQDVDWIEVYWEATSDSTASSFSLYRAESQSGPWDDQNLIYEEAAGEAVGGTSYSYDDFDVSPGVTYYYKLEEIMSSGESNWYGPITPTMETATATATQGGASATATRTYTPTQTPNPQSDSNPTATRQYTNTPSPTGVGPTTATQRPVSTTVVPRATPTPLRTVWITTPTGQPGLAPVRAAEVATLAATPSLTPDVSQVVTSADIAATSTPTLEPVAGTPSSTRTATPSPTAQRMASVPKQTVQPLLESVMAARLTPTASSTANEREAPNTRLALLLGGGALASAMLLGALIVLAWRLRSR